jgi:hypothetical protein
MHFVVSSFYSVHAVTVYDTIIYGGLVFLILPLGVYYRYIYKSKTHEKKLKELNYFV